MYLYEIVNKIDDKRYCGITNNISRRWREHRSDLKANRHHNPHLQNAWNIYGSGSFFVKIINKFNNIDDLNKAEVRHIEDKNLLNPKFGYNISEGGNGFTHSDTSLGRMSKNKGVSVISKCLETGIINKYDKISDVRVEGINPKSVSNACLDRALTLGGRVWMYLNDYDKNPQRLEEKRLSRQNVKARPSRYVPVMGVDKDTGKTVEYEACYHSKKDGFNPSHILRCCRGFRKTHKGFTWKFRDL